MPGSIRPRRETRSSRARLLAIVTVVIAAECYAGSSLGATASTVGVAKSPATGLSGGPLGHSRVR